MKKFVLLLLTLFLLFSCRNNRDSNPRQEASPPRVIKPHGNSEEIQQEETDMDLEEDRNFLTPMIALPPEETLLLTNDLNLDFDTEDEQIILSQKQVNESTQVLLYVVDYNNDDMVFYQAIKTTLSADSAEGLSILLQDLNGNTMNEIIITGFTKEQNHTFDAFTITSAGGVQGLRLKNILSLRINGIIDIENFERSQDYRMGKVTGESFPIITEETDTVSEENLDLIKTTYQWSAGQKKYAPVAIDKIPGLTIKEEQLEKIYKGSLEGFTSYIAGPWYKIEDLNRKKQPLLQEMIYFDPESSQIIFSVDNIQEIYDWNDTYRTIFKGINIQSRSSLITSLRRDIYLSLEELDRIKINIHGLTEWDGYYKPIDSNLQQSLMDHTGIGESEVLSHLSGQFRNNKGEDLNVELPYFTLKSGTETIAEGSIEFYILNEVSVMEMLYLKENGLQDHREVFSVEYQESTDSSRIIRTLTLTPGTLTTSGFTKTPGETIHYEQIEISETAPAEES